MPEQIDVTVLLFASLRQAAGTDRVSLRVPQGTPVGALWGLLPDPIPAIPAPAALRYALNDDWIHPGARLSDGDRVAMVLPVSGG